MRQTLPKSIILRGYQSFTKVISSGVSLHGTMLTAFVVTDSNEDNVMIGFSVPKKQVPLAAQRNRIKRLMREAVRKHIAGLQDDARLRKAGARIVLMFKRDKAKDLQRLTLHDVESSWTDILQRIQKAL